MNSKFGVMRGKPLNWDRQNDAEAAQIERYFFDKWYYFEELADDETAQLDLFIHNCSVEYRHLYFLILLQQNNQSFEDL